MSLGTTFVAVGRTGIVGVGRTGIVGVTTGCGAGVTCGMAGRNQAFGVDPGANDGVDVGDLHSSCVACTCCLKDSFSDISGIAGVSGLDLRLFTPQAAKASVWLRVWFCSSCSLRMVADISAMVGMWSFSVGTGSHGPYSWVFCSSSNPSIWSLLWLDMAVFGFLDFWMGFTTITTLDRTLKDAMPHGGRQLFGPRF